MNLNRQTLEKFIGASGDRFDFWISLANYRECASICEIGVFGGDFAEKLLSGCESIRRYYMIDPWRHLDQWDKPANTDDEVFNNLLMQTLQKTEFAKEKRVVLRGMTTEVIEEIPDESLDFVYIDGDHTLKGIAIDLIRAYRKVKPGGFIGGDDFSRSIWQHSLQFEPTLIFPFAVYFAEAMSVPVYALPYKQFLIPRAENSTFDFVDLTGKYSDTSLKSQFLRMIERLASGKKNKQSRV